MTSSKAQQKEGVIMARPKKDNVKFSTVMDRTLLEKVKEYSNETGLPINVVISKALKEYFETIKERA